MRPAAAFQTALGCSLLIVMTVAYAVVCWLVVEWTGFGEWVVGWLL